VFGGDVGAGEAAVLAGEFAGQGRVADLGGDAGDLVLVDVREAFVEEEREDVVFIFGGVEGATDGAGSLPEPVFEGGGVGSQNLQRN